MSDIRPGDVVVCVDAKPDRLDPSAAKLSEGKCYRVGAVGPRTNDGELSLAFHCLRSNVAGMGWAFTIRRFRKIDPADDTFTADMRALKPIKQGVSA